MTVYYIMGWKRVTIRGKKGSRDIRAYQVGFFRKGIGLMFRTSDTDILLFSFKKATRASITSCFVFFPFLALWLDDKNKVIESRIVKPFRLRIAPKEKFCRLVEIPVNSKNMKNIDFFVGKTEKSLNT